MRSISFFTALAAATALSAAASGAAVAQAADVTVSIGPELDRRAQELGRREVEERARALEARVQRALASRGGFEGARVELVLTDVTPNRPTMQQIGDKPGLSHFHSFGIGGAAIEGQVVMPGGEVRPVRYNWYSNNIRDARYSATWQDADRAFLNFSSRLASGRL